MHTNKVVDLDHFKQRKRMFTQKLFVDTIWRIFQNLTDTFFCKFLYKWLSQFGIPIPGVNFKDVLSGLSKKISYTNK